MLNWKMSNFGEVTKPGHHRYQVLDSLRGICACMVVIYHFHTVGWISNLPLVRNSWMFVDFFFVLSGFVITSAYRRRIADGLPIGSFMWLRLGRIYPVHLFMLGLFVAVQLALLIKSGGDQAFQGNMSVGKLIACLTLTQTLVLPSAIVWNGPSWSISVEMWTYLAFGALFQVFGARKGLITACVIIAAGSCVYIALTQAEYMFAFHYGAFFRCTYGFAIGVIGAEIFPLIRGKWSSVATAMELIAMGLVGIALSIVGKGPLTMLAPPMFLALILVFANEGGALSFGLKTKLPLLLGKLSYSIYMVHLFLLYRLLGLISFLHKGPSHSFLICDNLSSCSATGSPWLGDALLVPSLAAVVGAAYLLHKFVEVPCEQWAKNALLRRTKWFAGRTTKAAVSSQSVAS